MLHFQWVYVQQNTRTKLSHVNFFDSPKKIVYDKHEIKRRDAFSLFIRHDFVIHKKVKQNQYISQWWRFIECAIGADCDELQPLNEDNLWALLFERDFFFRSTIYSSHMTDDVLGRCDGYWNFACERFLFLGQRILSGLTRTTNNTISARICRMCCASKAKQRWWNIQHLRSYWIHKYNANVIIVYGWPSMLWKLSLLSLNRTISLSICVRDTHRNTHIHTHGIIVSLSFGTLRNFSSDNTFTISCNEILCELKFYSNDYVHI